MLRDGIPVDVSDGGDWTALHWAIMYNRTDVVKQLLHEGADVSRQFGYINETPLHYAAQLNNTEAARLLMGNGADINLKNYENKTPLMKPKKEVKLKVYFCSFNKVRHKGTFGWKSLF